MTNEIVPQVFESGEFGKLRTAGSPERPEFCARDVAAALGYKDTNNAVKHHCRGVAIYHPITDALGRTQDARFITEGDMYRLIAGSKLEGAQRFEAWVFDDVLPQIRRTGGYVPVSQDDDEMTILAKAVLIGQRTMEEQKATIARQGARISEQASQIEEMRPKALFADAVAASDGTCLVGELAKMMTQAGHPIGQNRLFKRMRDDGFLGKSGCNRNVPLQRFVEAGLFKIKETAITHADGHVTLSRTAKVTGKGQRYFLGRYCKGGDAA